MQGVWEPTERFFERVENARGGQRPTERTERLMEDYVGRPNTQSMSSAVGAFIVLKGDDEWKDDRHYRTDMERGDGWSLTAAEKLRKSFRPKTPPKRAFSHVRPPRPVPWQLREYAASLGVNIPDTVA